MIARLRDLTRYRKKLVEDRAKETQRIQKLLEDAGIKLDSVVSDVLGKSAREMLEALVAGQGDPEGLADMARTRMRPKIPELRRALEGRFGEHHALLLRVHLDHIDHLGSAIERLDAEVEKVIAPFGEQVRRLCTIPGVGTRTAEVLIAEIGVDMTRFPTAHHLASWAGLCPGNHESAGKRRSGRARKGRRYFVEKAVPPPEWAPSPDHYPRLKADGGQLDPWNVRLGHLRCNRADYGWRSRIRELLKKGKSLQKIADDLNKRKIPRPHGQTRWTALNVRKAFVSQRNTSVKPVRSGRGRADHR